MDLYSGMDLQLTIGEALGTDYFGLREPFTPQQEDYLTRTRAFVDSEVLPVINDYWERADFPYALIEKMETRVHRGNALQQILEAERCAAERVTTEPELEHEHD